MRKQSLFLVAIFSLFVAIEGHAIAEWEVFGPTTIVRGKGAPAKRTFTFSALGGQAIIKLTNTKVSSARATFNGEVVFGPSDFNQNISYLERGILLTKGQNTMEVSLTSKPVGELTIRIIQEVAEITPEIVLVRTANCLRAGDIQSASESFTRSSKDDVLMNIDSDGQSLLADWLENAMPIREKENYRAYGTEWIDEEGKNHNIEFIMVKDEAGKWEIISW